MKANLCAVSIFTLVCFLAGCGGQPGGDSDVAIQRAIEEHLSSRPGLASDKLVLEVKDIQVQGDTAEAEVVFRSRTDQAAMMAFHYQLRNEGNQWKVESGSPSQGRSPHPYPSSGNSPGAGGSLPEGHPPMEQFPAQPPQ